MFRGESNFRQLRFYLLASMLISVIMPSTSITINVDFLKDLFTNETTTITGSIKDVNTFVNPNESIIPVLSKVNWLSLFESIYFIITIALLIRIVIQIISVIIHYHKSNRVKVGKYLIISDNRFKNTSSFFHWIFINPESSSSEEFDQIISHEKIHASQYHSIDLIMIELLAAVMWFNPLVWMMRNSIQLVHEYLADEGALSTGIDRLKYQALLLNQATEERLICLSSNFNHSLIKKRMIMMTKSKFNQKTKLRLLTLFPVTAISFIVIASINGLFPNSAQASPKSANEIRQINGLAVASDTINRVTINKKSDKNSTLTIKVQPNNQKDDSKIIYVVDGVQVVNIDKINQDSIKSIDVLKKDNLIIIRTKGDEPKKDTIVIMNKKGDASSNILYFIDGIEKSGQFDINSIAPKTVENIEVIKGAQMKKYTNKEYDGIIMITTKKKKDK